MNNQDLISTLRGNTDWPEDIASGAADLIEKLLVENANPRAESARCRRVDVHRTASTQVLDS